MRHLSYVLDFVEEAVEATLPLAIKGRVTQVVGTIIKAAVPQVKIGEICLLQNPGETRVSQAEVVGFAKDAALLTPLGDMFGISSTTEVVPTGPVSYTHLDVYKRQG